MSSIPAEFYALANAFLFAVHNIFMKKALRYSNPATGVISTLLINIVFLWTIAFLFVPMANVTLASLLIFVGVGFLSARPNPLAHLQRHRCFGCGDHRSDPRQHAAV